jgi:Ca2+-binding EF-hand superfamily protein
VVDTTKYEATFTMLDTDGDGLVSAVEIRQLMETLGQEVTDETAAKAVEVMDTDGDGLVSLEELAGYLSSPQAPEPPHPDKPS